jgi:hypothetical protein
VRHREAATTAAAAVGHRKAAASTTATSAAQVSLLGARASHNGSRSEKNNCKGTSFGSSFRTHGFRPPRRAPSLNACLKGEFQITAAGWTFAEAYRRDQNGPKLAAGEAPRKILG